MYAFHTGIQNDYNNLGLGCDSERQNEKKIKCGKWLVTFYFSQFLGFFTKNICLKNLTNEISHNEA